MNLNMISIKTKSKDNRSNNNCKHNLSPLFDLIHINIIITFQQKVNQKVYIKHTLQI